MKCDIILLVWNQYELTKKCIESIYENTLVQSRLIIVDNASDDDKVKDYLESVRSAGNIEVQLIRNEKNEGFVGGMNTGIAASTAPFACLLNNDTVVTSGWLGEMIDIAQSNDKIGIVNPVSNNFGVFPAQGEDIASLAVRLSKRRGTFMEVGACVGFCMLIKRTVIAEIGALDRGLNRFFFEDTDYSRRAVQAGFICAIARGAYIFHREHSSVNKLGSRREKIFKQNQKLFYKKWGRPVRAVVFVSNIPGNSAEFKEIIEYCVWLGRKGSFVQIYLKKPDSITRAELFGMHNMIEHGNIQVFTGKGKRFGLFAFFRVIKKLKKRYDIVITDNRSLARFLKFFGLFHCAVVLVKPDIKRIEEIWKKKSVYR